MITTITTPFLAHGKHYFKLIESERSANRNIFVTFLVFLFFPAEPNPIQNNGLGVLSNKLSRLTLATFDDEGRCIGQMGSLSISY